jgi:hypothetical protein
MDDPQANPAKSRIPHFSLMSILRRAGTAYAQIDDQPVKPIRWRIPRRFSLLTLMILMALLGAGYALYAGWDPWEPLCTITIPPPRRKIQRRDHVAIPHN